MVLNLWVAAMTDMWVAVVTGTVSVITTDQFADWPLPAQTWVPDPYNPPTHLINVCLIRQSKEASAWFLGMWMI